MDHSGGIYFEAFYRFPNGDYTTYFYIFDPQKEEIIKELSIPVRNIEYVDFMNSKIYFAGAKSPHEANDYSYLVFEYDKNSEELRQVYKLEKFTGLAIKNGFMFYGERGSSNGVKPPKVTIYNLLEEKKEAEIIGKGLGPNPLTYYIKFSLMWLNSPLLYLYYFLTFPLRLFG